MREKLHKVGLKKRDYIIRKVCITCTTLTVLSCAILVPVSMTKLVNADKPMVQNKDGLGIEDNVVANDAYDLSYID